MIIQLSTGGSVHDPLERRLMALDADPDSASLTCGTTNFGNDVFLNPHPFMTQLYRQAQERDGINGLGAPLSLTNPRAWVAQIDEKAAASRGLNCPIAPCFADIVDPNRREDEVFATMAQQTVQSMPAVVRALGR
jgi:hypothetical protein